MRTAKHTFTRNVSTSSTELFALSRLSKSNSFRNIKQIPSGSPRDNYFSSQENSYDDFCTNSKYERLHSFGLLPQFKWDFIPLNSDLFTIPIPRSLENVEVLYPYLIEKCPVLKAQRYVFILFLINFDGFLI